MPGSRRNRDNHRAVRIDAQTELLATRPEVWALLAEPEHLADWWPAYASIRPDRRGLAEGARWEVVRGGSIAGTTSSSASPRSSCSSPPPTA